MEDIAASNYMCAGWQVHTQWQEHFVVRCCVAFMTRGAASYVEALCCTAAYLIVCRALA